MVVKASRVRLTLSSHSKIDRIIYCSPNVTYGTLRSARWGGGGGGGGRGSGGGGGGGGGRRAAKGRQNFKSL